ncbi:hypothetical protein C2857_007700 [Epichloe festucae Fl1]|uniref:Serine-threonine/tyrosine-protein kinase catalytic domain-containing protein n=1 Tax=Epichloe festucae (strain Fl1) TaxID=877507 RepID=A0A7S9KR17_EPIFF|nr:hypothetical protein C2857_007700 [Epichloe festucae Fl1]
MPSSRIFHWSQSLFCATYSQRDFPISEAHSVASNSSPSNEDIYFPKINLEDFEDYTIGGYHPNNVGDTFHNGRIEATILQILCSSDQTHPGRLFIPRLLDNLSFDGPNGHHVCLVQDPAGCGLAVFKEDLGGLDVSCPDCEVHHRSSSSWVYPTCTLVECVMAISDYGTSFMVSTKTSHELHTPAAYLPPEDFFSEPITQAADVWTLGVNLYEVLGERALFKTFDWDRDDLIVNMGANPSAPKLLTAFNGAFRAALSAAAISTYLTTTKQSNVGG